MLQKEISDLYLKIKRCSKDTSLTESQYIRDVETAEEKEERMLIKRLDPFIVLQYISSSIDVIINLKFEDIENKMMEKADITKSINASVNETPEKIKKKLAMTERQRSAKRSCDFTKFPENQSISSAGHPSCPRVYEEIIQGLEADIRKHIRIEH